MTTTNLPPVIPVHFLSDADIDKVPGPLWGGNPFDESGADRTFWGTATGASSAAAVRATTIAYAVANPQQYELFILLPPGSEWLDPGLAVSAGAPSANVDWQHAVDVGERWVWADAQYVVVVHRVEKQVILPTMACSRRFLNHTDPVGETRRNVVWSGRGALSVPIISEPLPLSGPSCVALLYVGAYCCWFIRMDGIHPISVVWLIPHVIFHTPATSTGPQLPLTQRQQRWVMVPQAPSSEQPHHMAVWDGVKDNIAEEATRELLGQLLQSVVQPCDRFESWNRQLTHYVSTSCTSEPVAGSLRLRPTVSVLVQGPDPTFTTGRVVAKVYESR